MPCQDLPAVDARDGEQAKMRLLVVLGEGGHTTELLHLIDLLGNRYDYSYIISKKDNLSVSKIRYRGPIYRVSRPRGKRSRHVRSICRTVQAAFESFLILLRIRPAALLSTGPAIAVPVALMAKVLHVRIIFIETASRIRELSLTGRIMYRLADLFFVQWPQLQETLPDAIYTGRLC